MKKQKLNFRFHNPNTAEATADMILKVFIEVNAQKVDAAVKEAAEQISETKKNVEISNMVL